MPIKLCRCGAPAAYRGRCAACSRSNERATHPNKSIYNSVKWRYTRRRALHIEPLCRQCGDIATDVDHITPIERGGAIFDPGNLQALCRACHGAKTKREMGAR